MSTPLWFHPSYRVSLVPGEGVFWTSADDVFAFDAAYETAARSIARRLSYDDVARAMSGEIGLVPACFLLDALLERKLILEQRDRPSPPPASDASIARVVQRLVGVEGLRVVVSSEPFDERHAELNRRAMRTATPWVLVDPAAHSHFLGAMFVPGQTGCWECLTFRLGRLRPAEAYLHARGATILALPARVSRLDAESSLAARRAAVLVVRRPGCPVCGDKRHLEARRCQLPDMSDQPATPARYLVDPINGVTSSLKGIRVAYPHRRYVYAATPTGDGRSCDVGAVHRALSNRAAGSGQTRRAALRAVIGEAVERHCGIAYGDERDVRATYEQLGEDAIAPNDYMLFSEAQYAGRAHANRLGEPAMRVPVPFSPSARLDWTVVWSLLTGRRRFLPTACAVRGSPATLGSKYCVADTNGCAAGRTLPDAIVRGFMELVERDAIAIWWYNRLRVPRIDDLTNQLGVRSSVARGRAGAREFWLLDLTTDLGIPVVAAVSRRTDAACERLVFGFGAAWRPERAARHAIGEMAQMAVAADQIPDATLLCDDRLLCEWLRGATAAEMDFLRGSSGAPRAFNSASGGQIPTRQSEVALHCAELAARHGMDLCVFDQTRTDLGLPVARVIVPGLRPAVPRFAPGRLFTVARRLHSVAAIDEAHLNPWPFVF